MRSADTLTGFAAEEIRIAVAPHKTAGILINRVIDVYISQIGHGKQARHIGIVHQQMITETINLESINGTKFRMIVGCIAFQSHFHLIGQGTAIGSQSSLLVHCFQNLGSLTQGSDSKEVGRHKELKRCGIVRRAEAGHDKSHRTDRSTQTIIVQRIERTLRLALKFVGTGTLFALLLTKSSINIADGFQPFSTENRSVTRHLPVVISQPQGITKRVDFPFAFMQFGLHVSKVTHPMPIGQRTVVVGIRIRVDIDALELAQNNTSQHLFQFRVVVGKLHIWPYLRP